MPRRDAYANVFAMLPILLGGVWPLRTYPRSLNELVILSHEKGSASEDLSPMRWTLPTTGCGLPGGL